MDVTGVDKQRDYENKDPDEEGLDLRTLLKSSFNINFFTLWWKWIVWPAYILENLSKIFDIWDPVWGLGTLVLETLDQDP